VRTQKTLLHQHITLQHVDKGELIVFRPKLFDDGFDQLKNELGITVRVEDTGVDYRDSDLLPIDVVQQYMVSHFIPRSALRYPQ
jgi:hypothetical protein